MDLKTKPKDHHDALRHGNNPRQSIDSTAFEGGGSATGLVILY